MKMMRKFLASVLILAFAVMPAAACSRVTYTTKDGSVVTGRTMDWETYDAPSIRVVPRGTEYTSRTGKFGWKAKYGNICVYSDTKRDNISLAMLNSGINEKGLACDILFLEASEYAKAGEKNAVVGVSEYLKYIIENFATAEEVANFAKEAKILPTLLNIEIFGKYKATLHFIVTDKTGDNTIIEFIDGKANVYHKKGRIVMTNDPAYDKMCAIADYFKQVGMLRNMPGSSLSEARFVYATGWLNEFVDDKLPGYIQGITDKNFDNQAVMSVLSLMRGVSTPLGVQVSDAEPNNTSTLWRTVIDVKNGKLYFDSALSFATVWIDVNKVDFSKKHQILDLASGRIINGDVTELFK